MEENLANGLAALCSNSKSKLFNENDTFSCVNIFHGTIAVHSYFFKVIPQNYCSSYDLFIKVKQLITS